MKNWLQRIPDLAMGGIGVAALAFVVYMLVCLAVKGIRYEIDPIVPFYGSDEFGRISPVRRIPVLVDELGTICDSTVICEYLEDRYPFPPLLPKAPHDRAQARWLEEFADSRMGEVFIWHYYNQLVIRRFVWGEDPDAAVVRKATKEVLIALKCCSPLPVKPLLIWSPKEDSRNYCCRRLISTHFICSTSNSRHRKHSQHINGRC